MADINVERKSPGVWPWVLGLLVLALVIWGLVELFGGGDQDAMRADDPLTPADTAVAGAPAPFPDTAAPAGPAMGDTVPTTPP